MCVRLIRIASSWSPLWLYRRAIRVGSFSSRRQTRAPLLPGLHQLASDTKAVPSASNVVQQQGLWFVKQAVWRLLPTVMTPRGGPLDCVRSNRKHSPSVACCILGTRSLCMTLSPHLACLSFERSQAFVFVGCGKQSICVPEPSGTAQTDVTPRKRQSR